MNNKQKQMVEVMEWAEARLVDGWLFEMDGPSGFGAAMRMYKTSSYLWGRGETELAARIALMEKWEARHGDVAAVEKRWDEFVMGQSSTFSVCVVDTSDGYGLKVQNFYAGIHTLAAGETVAKRRVMAAWDALSNG